MQAKAQFKRRSTANNVEILVPVPEDADSPRFRTNIGSVHYAPEKSAIIWKIKQFGGGKEFLMRAELGLPSVKGDDEHGGGMTGGFGGSMGGAGQTSKGKRPISVKFEIPYFTTSGIQVRYLKIIEPKVSDQKYFLSQDLFFLFPPPSPLLATCTTANLTLPITGASDAATGLIRAPLCVILGTRSSSLILPNHHRPWLVLAPGIPHTTFPDSALLFMLFKCMRILLTLWID